VLAIIGSMFFAIYLSLSNSVLKDIAYPISLHFVSISLVGVFVCYVMGHLSGEHFIVFSLDPHYGVFGFLSSL